MPSTAHARRNPDDIIVTKAGAIITERDRDRRHTQRRRARHAARTEAELARDRRLIFPDGHAVCRDCGLRKPITAFVRDLSRFSTIRPHCLDCRVQRIAVREQDTRLV